MRQVILTLRQSLTKLIMARQLKTNIMGTSYNIDTPAKKTRQGNGKNSKYSATSRNSARKPYRGQGK